MPGILNVGNSYSPNNKKITSKLTFDVGEKFSGKVIKGDNNEVTIKLMDGWEFSAVIEGDISDLQNILQRFTVEGYENGKLKLKLIDKNSGDEEVSKDFTAIINKQGLKGNDKELLEAMIKFNIPLTKENIRDIKGLVQFLDKIKDNPKEIEEFITKYLETKGIDVNSEVGEKLGNTLKEFFTAFKGLTKDDILLFIESGIDFNKENIDSYNNIFKGNSSINDLLKEFDNANNSSKDENNLTSSSKFAKDVYQKTESNNAKVSMSSLLKSMTGKSEDIINVTLKEVLTTRRNTFTNQDFERLFNNINNMDSSKIVEKLITTINEYSQIGNDIASNDFSNYLEKVNNEKLGINESLNFSKGQLDKVLSEVMGNNISLTSDEFEKLKDAINSKYSNMLEYGFIKEDALGENQKVVLNNINEKEAILKNEIPQSSNIDSLKSGKTLEDSTIKHESTKEVVQQIISKTGENNKEIIKDIDENSLTSSSKFAKDVYQKTDSNNAKVSMLSLLKSMTGKSEDIINVTLKEVLTIRRNDFISQDFERLFNNISNIDSSKIVEKLITTINDYSQIGNDIASNDFSNYLEKVNNEKLGINESLNFSKGQLDKVLSELMGNNISLTSDEFEKLKDAINLKYSNMLEDGSIKEDVLGKNQKLVVNDEVLKNNINNETSRNSENSKITNNINEISQSSNIDSLKSGNTLEDGTIKHASTKEVVQQIISKTGENNKEIIKDVLSALKSEGDISEKILTIIKNNINDIKIFNKFSGDYYYANLPVNIKEREYPCKVIVKDNRKEGKKIDSKNVKMVITIDTKNLGIVDGYMKVNDRRIDVDLKCQEKSVKILDMAKEKLTTNIENMGFSVNVKVYKKLEEVSLTTCRDFFNTGAKVSLDRRV